jgi:hypothetical protein
MAPARLVSRRRNAGMEMAFAIDRLRVLSPDHPDWANHQPFQSAPAGDIGAVAQGGLTVRAQSSLPLKPEPPRISSMGSFEIG